MISLRSQQLMMNPSALPDSPKRPASAAKLSTCMGSPQILQISGGGISLLSTIHLPIAARWAATRLASCSP